MGASYIAGHPPIVIYSICAKIPPYSYCNRPLVCVFLQPQPLAWRHVQACLIAHAHCAAAARKAPARCVAAGVWASAALVGWIHGCDHPEGAGPSGVNQHFAGSSHGLCTRRSARVVLGQASRRIHMPASWPHSLARRAAPRRAVSPRRSASSPGHKDGATAAQRE